MSSSSISCIVHLHTSSLVRRTKAKSHNAPMLTDINFVSYICISIQCVPLISILVDQLMPRVLDDDANDVVGHDDDDVRLECSRVTEPETSVSDGVASDI